MEMLQGTEAVVLTITDGTKAEKGRVLHIDFDLMRKQGSMTVGKMKEDGSLGTTDQFDLIPDKGGGMTIIPPNSADSDDFFIGSGSASKTDDDKKDEKDDTKMLLGGALVLLIGAILLKPGALKL
jgi:hypothetical protein